MIDLRQKLSFKVLTLTCSYKYFDAGFLLLVYKF